MKKQFITTFDDEFIKKMKMEALKRDLHVNELIELAIKMYLKEEEDNE